MYFFRVKVLICWYAFLTENCEAIWNHFATSPQYANFRLVTRDESSFVPIMYPKSMPMMWAKMECSIECVSNDTCKAFNFLDTVDNYVCEQLTQNICTFNWLKAMTELVGSYVWEKITTISNSSCLEPSKPVACELLRPGCEGTWPNCVNCVKHCMDCRKRYNFTGFYDCTLWPDGDGPSSVPIFGTCIEQETYIFRRRIDLNSGRPTVDYRMSVLDMHRLARLRAYPKIGFWFLSLDNNLYSSIYTNPVIDSNGTLMNMSFLSSYPAEFDVFNLNGKPLPPTPFVFVNDDKFGCGSFWLIDTNNPIFCPGGSVNLLGTLQVQVYPFKVVSTGIRWPAFPTGTVLVYGVVKLSP